MADELAIMQGIYVLCASQDAANKKVKGAQPSASGSSKSTAAPSEAKDAQPKKEPPAKKVLDPLTPEMLKKFEKLVAVGEECLEKEEMQILMQARPGAFRLYDGFEPSGRMHIAQGVFKSINVNTCTDAGGIFVFWVADFFALMNDKMGGDLEKIKVVGEYLVEVWKAAGMNMERVKFVWASDAIIEKADLYSRIVADIARRFTVARLTKCCQIMGRKEGNLSAAQVLYPIMQCADVFFLEADICQLGLDQRKVNMLARDYAQVSGRRFKPVILSHHMLFGLKQGQEKMSKSDADSAIFMEDSAEDVERKIRAAYCPRDIPEAEKNDLLSLLQNPCLDYVKHICLHGQDGAEFAGFKTYAEVRHAFVSGSLDESTLKAKLIERINNKLEPVRAHFSSGRPRELLESVKRFKEETVAKDKAKLEAQKKAAEQGMPMDGPDDEDVVIGRRKRASDMPILRRCIPKVLESKPCSAVVFLPAPRMFRGIPVADVLSVVVRLTRAIEMQSEEETIAGEKIALFVPDLGFLCQNALADMDVEAALKRKSDEKGPFASVGKKSSPTMEIEAYIEAFVGAVKSLIKYPDRFVVVRQSDLMGDDPMNYLLSIINVGRAFKLEEVLNAVGIHGDLEGGRVGYVIDALFFVADVLALGPVKRIIIEQRHESLTNLAISFFHTEFVKEYDAGQAPVKVKVEMPEIRLVKTPEDVDVESIVYISDDDKEVANKVKRAFCEIGNIQLNPVLNGICALLEMSELSHLRLSGQVLLQVSRSPENGGNVNFSSVADAFAAFSKGTTEGAFPLDALHPGDLKNSALPFFKSLVEKARKSIPVTSAKVLDACRKRNPERIVQG